MSEKEYMNIAIALNDNFMFPTRVMLHSLCRHASRPIYFILMYNDLTVTNRKILRNLVESYDNTIREFFIEKEWFKDASLCDNPLLSIETYYRIMLPYIADEEKILWLDGDIIVRSDIAALYDTDISDYYIAASKDIGEIKNTRTELKEVLGIPQQVYFNAGILLMNNKKIGSEIKKEAFFKAIAAYSDMLRCADQDILNIMLGGNCLMLSNNFNYQLHCDNSDLDDDVKIIHYIWKKPWNADYPGYLDEPFWNEAVSCGFGKEYKKYKRQRKMNFYKNELIPAAMSKIKRKK